MAGLEGRGRSVSLLPPQQLGDSSSTRIAGPWAPWLKAVWTPPPSPSPVHYPQRPFQVVIQWMGFTHQGIEDIINPERAINQPEGRGSGPVFGPETRLPGSTVTSPLSPTLTHQWVLHTYVLNINKTQDRKLDFLFFKKLVEPNFNFTFEREFFSFIRNFTSVCI